MGWQCKYCKREFSRPYALTQHISQKHPYDNDTTDQNLNEQIDIWNLPNYVTENDDSRNKSLQESSQSIIVCENKEISESSQSELGSFIEIEPFSTDNVSENDEPQLESNESDIEDYEGASFDDAFHDLQDQTVEWPNDAYRDIMIIINKYQLSNQTGDNIINFFNKYSNLDISPLPSSTKIGKEFLDNSAPPYMEFKETPIVTFQNISYKLYYRSLIKTIKSLLMINNVNRSLVLNYEKKIEIKNGNEQQVFKEQYNCNWWKREESLLLPGQRLLSIILYSDATTLDHMGKSSGHPIFLSLGNIPNSQRNKPESKALIGYFPILKAKDSKTKNSESFRQLLRDVFQKCITILLRPIVDGPEFHFAVCGNIVTFVPRISMILADLAEANKIANVYQPSTSKRPCYSCLVSKDDLNNLNIKNILPRTPKNMRHAIYNNETQYYSIHPEINAFWELRNFNIYMSIAPDRMHILDLGLFKYMFDYTKDLLNDQCEKHVVQTFEIRLTSIPRYQGLKIFKNLSDITRMTANELRNLMKIIIFALDNLYDKYRKPGISNKQLCQVYYKFLKMYITSREESFNNDSFDQLQTIINDWAQEFVEIFSQYSPSGLQLPKLHTWCYHLVPAIKEFGAVNSMTTETYETLHKNYVKKPYRMSNKKDYMSQIVKTIKRQKLTESEALKKTRRSKGFGRLLWILNLENLDSFIQKNISNLNPLQIEGFHSLLIGLDEFFDDESNAFINDDHRLELFSSAALESTDIIRASSNFHGSPSFSNVIISGIYENEEVNWYGLVLLIFKFYQSPDSIPLEFALVRWYEENGELWECPKLKLTKQYSCIPIDSIDRTMHIVPRFDKTNEYLVNNFMF